MKPHDRAALLLYRAIGPIARLASAVLPESMHPGLRAYPVVAGLGMAPGRTCFAAAVLESFLRSLLLQRYLVGLEESALRQFVEQRVDYDNGVEPAYLLGESRPLILATPHYGAPVAALMASAHLLKGRRTLNVFYDEARHGARLADFFDRAGIRAGALLSGSTGVRSSLRALERGECVAILPDAFDDIATTLVVPFFNRLLRVAAGTAFLALRSDALIVPAFAMPRCEFGLSMRLCEPIDPRRVDAQDEAQALFVLTRLLFARIEEQLRFVPEHWRHWDVLPRISTPLGASEDLSDSQLMLALEAKLRALPAVVQDIPELELLLQ